MLYLHQVGSVKVGDVVRYTIAYTPSRDTESRPNKLHVRIRNTEAAALRAAIIPGPFLLSVCAYPAIYNPFQKLQDPESHGVPAFEPQVKAGCNWNCELLIPREAQQQAEGSPAATISWVVEVTSQVVFSKSASVRYDLMVASDTQFPVSSIAGLSFGSGGPPGKLEDHQKYMRATGRPGTRLSSGIFSEAMALKVEDTAILWNSPPLVSDTRHSPNPEGAGGNPRGLGAHHQSQPKKVHLVILTHGLQCNLTADMLFMKETIEAVAREAKESRGRADDEEVIVRGYSDNATRTQRGVRFLGKRVAKYVLSMTYPDQPYLPTGATPQQGFTQGVARDHDAYHGYAHPYAPDEYRDEKRQSYRVTSISFVGHSLGGPTQVFALAYIQRCCPTFFDLIKPRNFITVASPLMGIGAESAPYVRLALESGLVGITGRDLGLSWGVNTVVRNRWGAFLAGRGQSRKAPGDGQRATEPLLRILPSGLAHNVLKRFERRTAYANTVNDGIVPLRTSCLLFLDWQSIDKVERAQRDAHFIESIATRAWREFSGGHSVPSAHREWKPVQESSSSGTTGPTVPPPADVYHSYTAPVMNSAEEDSGKYVSRKHKKMLGKGQVLSSQPKDMHPGIRAPPETTFFEWVGDLMNSAVADMDHIIDPDKRPRTILHDRLYHPVDIPPLQDPSSAPVEEKIARAYHCDMSWRKVLVRLEPDAHISICVRRMFPDSQGWPVLKHLADTHFVDSATITSPAEACNSDIDLLNENEHDAEARRREEAHVLDDNGSDGEDDNFFANLARASRQVKAGTWYAGQRLA